MEVERQYREFSKRTRVHGNTNGAYRPLNNVERLNMARAHCSPSVYRSPCPTAWPSLLFPPPPPVFSSLFVTFLHRAITIATGIRDFSFFILRRTRRKGARYTIRLILSFFNCSRKLFSIFRPRQFRLSMHAWSNRFLPSFP